MSDVFAEALAHAGEGRTVLLLEDVGKNLVIAGVILISSLKQLDIN